MTESDWTPRLGWLGYEVYRIDFHEPLKRLTLRVFRKRGNKQLAYSCCERSVSSIVQTDQRELSDLSQSIYHATVIIERFQVSGPDCGAKAEKCYCCRAKLPSAGGSKMLRAKPARAPRPVVWTNSLACRRALCGLLISRI